MKKVGKTLDDYGVKDGSTLNLEIVENINITEF